MTDSGTPSLTTRFWHPFADMGAVRSAEFVVTRAEDVWVWDADGRRYLDATASLWYANVGHGRPEIAQAVAAQMSQLETYSAFGDFANPPALELCERLADLAPVPGARVFLGSGGGDGIEAAAKLARRYWSAVGSPERTHIISRTGAYHGTHGYGTALGGIDPNRRASASSTRTLSGRPRLAAGSGGGDRADRIRARGRVLHGAGDRRRRRLPARCRIHRGRSPSCVGAPACCS